MAVTEEEEESVRGRIATTAIGIVTTISIAITTRLPQSYYENDRMVVWGIMHSRLLQQQLLLLLLLLLFIGI